MKKRLLVFSLSFLISSLGIQAVLAKNNDDAWHQPNHYIILFDASGSMKSDFASEYNFWQGNTKNSGKMAERLSDLVEKTLSERISKEIPTIKETDLFSFTFFRLDYDKPNYSPQYMFMTNAQLCLRRGIPEAHDYFEIEKLSDDGKKETKELKFAFAGHSPIVAATSLTLPFISDYIKKKDLMRSSSSIRDVHVKRTFLVRITDGTYNSLAYASDEYACILKIIEGKPNIALPVNYDEYLETTKQVNDVFWIGAQVKNCVLVTHDVGDCMSKPFICDPTEFEKVRKSGKGFLFSYLEAKPRRPAINDLILTNKRAIVFQRRARNGELEFQGFNIVKALTKENYKQWGLLQPNQVHYRIGNDGPWNLCTVMNDGKVKCRGNANEWILNEKTDAIRHLEGRKEFPYSLNYRFDYTQKLDPHFYPFPFAIEPANLSLDLQIDPASLSENNLLHPSPITHFKTRIHNWFNPMLLLTGPEKPGFPFPITDEILIQQSLQAAFQDRPVTPQEVAASTKETKTSYQAIADMDAFINKTIWYSLSLLLLMLYIWFPRAKLKIETQDMVNEGVMIDFNNRKHDQIVLIGLAKIQNITSALNKNKKFNLSIEVKTPKFELNGSGEYKDEASRPSSDILEFNSQNIVGVGKPGQRKLKDKTVPAGKEYPFFFSLPDISDVQLPAAGKEQVELDVYIPVEIHEGSSNSTEFNFNYLLVIRPEIDKLKLMTELGPDVEKHAEGAKQILSSYYDAEDTEKLICTYDLQNKTEHKFSWSAEGILQLEVFDNEQNEAPGIICMVGMDSKPVNKLLYRIEPSESLPIHLIADYTQFENPVDVEQYHVRLYSEKIDILTKGRKKRLLGVDQWVWKVCRSRKRTDPFMWVKATSINKASPKLNEIRSSLPNSFDISNKNNRILIGLDSYRADTKLCEVKLENSCHVGWGYTRWRSNLKIVNDPTGIELTPENIRLLNDRDLVMTEGILKDSTDDSERIISLGMWLSASTEDTNNLKILQQFMRFDIVIGIDWEVFEEGEKTPDDKVKKFRTEIRLHLELEHKPPQRSLSIDFGTSALAIARITGQKSELLPLHQHLVSMKGEKGFSWDSPDGSSPFLSSECNVQEGFIEADSPSFLQLPLEETMFADHPHLVLKSLKLLVSAGYKTIPLKLFEYKINAKTKKKETHNIKKEVQLGKIIKGAYKGILENYIHPLLISEKGHSGFSHLFVTHPNTYTKNHISELRDIIEDVFVNSEWIESPDIVYPDNIHLQSESDAVLYNYLTKRKKYWKELKNIPENEKILVYDIGAGTLDMTYLEVKSEKIKKTPLEINIINRDGGNRAGCLLDECIARDLHEQLQKEFENTSLYINKIVVESEEKIDHDTRPVMELLRKEILKLKSELNQVEHYNMRLSYQKIILKKPILKNPGGTDTIEQYKDHINVAIIDDDLYWRTDYKSVMKGQYAKAFFEQVTKTELLTFFNHEIPPINTVIVSGRTSLWPGFIDMLNQTLTKVDMWVHFDENPVELKAAFVKGVMEKTNRWPNLVINDPGLFGKFAVMYEYPAPQEWHLDLFDHSGETKTLDLSNASMVYIGLKTNNDFKRCYMFSKVEYSLDYLKVTLEFDNDGYLKAIIRDEDNNEKAMFRGTGNVALLPYNKQPWPLGVSKLKRRTPEEVISSTFSYNPNNAI